MVFKAAVGIICGIETRFKMGVMLLEGAVGVAGSIEMSLGEAVGGAGGIEMSLGGAVGREEGIETSLGGAVGITERIVALLEGAISLSLGIEDDFWAAPKCVGWVIPCQILARRGLWLEREAPTFCGPSFNRRPVKPANASGTSPAGFCGL